MTANPMRMMVHACDNPRMIPILKVYVCDGTCNQSPSDETAARHPDLVSVEQCATCNYVKSTPPSISTVSAVRTLTGWDIALTQGE